MTDEPRLTPTQRLHEVTMQALSRSSAPTSSVELTRNAKGDTQIAVKVAAETVQQANDEAQRIYDGLCVLYPNGNGA